MSIRGYLLLSYLALTLLMAAGMWLSAHYLAVGLADSNLRQAQQGAQRTLKAASHIAEEVLTTYGEALVDSRVKGVAKGLAYRLKGRDLSDYTALRRDEDLRRLATQSIDTPEGEAGFFMLYDRKGEVIFFRRKDIEGKNSREWQPEQQEMHDLLERSLTEDHVRGYYTYFDRSLGKDRRRYTSRVHVPGTPFILAAQVNIDQFFVPAQEKIAQATLFILAEAQGRIEANAHALKNEILFYALAGAGLLALVSVGASLWFAASLSRPLEELSAGVEQVGEGDFSVTVPETGVREVRHLAQSFNRLGGQLSDYIAKRDFIRDTFSRYVTKEVVKKLLESQDWRLGGEIREVSLLISDLRGFTALTATMAPEQVIELLNRYLGKMIEILLDNEAIIDEIVGDGILAFFGAPEPLPDHPARAVATALKMQLAMEEINRLNQADGLPRLEMGIAVNTGQVVVGNIGSERRAKYSVVGSHVNFTSRVEALALGGQVFISAATYERVKDLVTLGDVVQVEVKGMPGLATLYEVRGLKGEYNLHLTGREETLVALPVRLPVRVLRLEEKIVKGEAGHAWLTHLSETGARLWCDGELSPWEDVNLRFIEPPHQEIPGHAYGKVVQIQAGDPLKTATVRFTSLSSEALAFIRRTVGQTKGEKPS